MKQLHFIALLIALISLITVTVGCDEGMTLADPVISEPMEETPETPTEQTEVPDPSEETPEPADPITTLGEMKDPEMQEPEGSTETPEEPEVPTEVEVPDPMVPEVIDDPNTFFVHGDGTSDILASAWDKPSADGDDFVGCVFVPKVDSQFIRPRQYAYPLSGVVVTILSGTRSGEQVTTDENGQYRFPDVEEDELHLRVEKQHFETKEVVVHRSEQTVLPGGIVPNYMNDPQKTPGNILMGQRWPDEVRFILRKTVVMPDLLYIEARFSGKLGGRYASGVVIVDSNKIIDIVGIYSGRSVALDTIAHEIAHAHQQFIGGGSMQGWYETAECKAYAEAQKKDWEEHGKVEYLDTDPHFRYSLLENSAEICTHYWSDSWDDQESVYANGPLKDLAPNRLRWVAEWVMKK